MFCSPTQNILSIHYAFFQSSWWRLQAFERKRGPERNNNVFSEIKTEVIDVEPIAKMDNRFFGELLAEVYRKNTDIHTCISEHVAKIRGRWESLS